MFVQVVVSMPYCYNMDYDYRTDAELSEDNSRHKKLNVVMSYSEELENLENQAEELELKLEATRSRISHLGNIVIPRLMEDLDLLRLTTQSGRLIEIKEDVRGTQPKEGDPRREKMFEWLRVNSAEKLIKNRIVIELNKGDDLTANSILEILRVYDPSLPIERTEALNHQSMLAFLRERRREGQAVPVELFGCKWEKFTKIKQGR